MLKSAAGIITGIASSKTISRETDLDRLVSQIVETVSPIKIVLFGSTARGDAQTGSDYDLLVVMPAGTHRMKTMSRLYASISGITRDFDLIVATESDIDKYGDKPGPIYKTALEKGITVYAL